MTDTLLLLAGGLLGMACGWALLVAFARPAQLAVAIDGKLGEWRKPISIRGDYGQAAGGKPVASRAATDRRIALRLYAVDVLGRRVILDLTSASQRRVPAWICSVISSYASVTAWCTILAITSSSGNGSTEASGESSKRGLHRSLMTIFRLIMAVAGWRVRVTIASTGRVCPAWLRRANA